MATGARILENKPAVYLAGPWFRDGQEERLEKIEEMLDKHGVSYYAPRIDGPKLSMDASKEQREEAFNDNVSHIKTADLVISVTDGLDTGTIWESGLANGLQVPVMFFAETLGDRQFNLMLANSGIGVALSMEDLTQYIEDLNVDLSYEGVIE